MKAKVEDFVGIYEDAFSLDYCNEVIRQFEILNEQGFTSSRQKLNMGTKVEKDDTAVWTGEFHVNETETSGMHISIGQEFNNVYWDQCYPHYSENFAVMKNMEHHTIYGNKVQKTGIGGGFHQWHCETMGRAHGNRLLTHIVYLNDVEDGGETELLYYHKRFKPKAGTMLIFPAAYTHTHRGNPPLSNEKYIITGWTEF